jgi:hypothetical protein
MFDGKAFGQEIVAAVKSHIDRIMEPVLRRLDDLDAAVAKDPAVGSVDLIALKSDVESLRDVLAGLSVPTTDEIADIAAKSAPTNDDIQMWVRQAVDPAMAVLPTVETVAKAVADAIAALPLPKDGADADPVVIERMVAEEVAKLPPAEPGRSVTADELRPMVEETVGKAVAALPKALDGCGIKELLIDRDGALVATMDDGRVKSLGKVVGADGVDVDMAAVERRIGEMVEALPKAKDGADGADGIDGLGFDDFDLVEGERGLTLRFARGEVVKEFPLPVVIDRGVWRQQEYTKGAGVTWSGSFWIAQRDTADKPETSDAWRLAVKRGQNGKDGKAA